eukprot:TRINITY_DN735_c0_g2_i4.p1 TRINITY_DN735_c0_g2~~TRINITY_DN735_c0_g2_i4.p1  ORF type:complete len:1231 (+),score=323.26 TRINITY_DN735_c0_g2_i4:127-3819(+)
MALPAVRSPSQQRRSQSLQHPAAELEAATQGPSKASSEADLRALHDLQPSAPTPGLAVGGIRALKSSDSPARVGGTPPVANLPGRVSPTPLGDTVLGPRNSPIPPAGGSSGGPLSPARAWAGPAGGRLPPLPDLPISQRLAQLREEIAAALSGARSSPLESSTQRTATSPQGEKMDSAELRRCASELDAMLRLVTLAAPGGDEPELVLPLPAHTGRADGGKGSPCGSPAPSTSPHPPPGPRPDGDSTGRRSPGPARLDRSGLREPPHIQVNSPNIAPCASPPGVRPITYGLLSPSAGGSSNMASPSNQPGMASPGSLARRRHVNASLVAVEYAGTDVAAASSVISAFDTATRHHQGRVLGIVGGTAVAAWNIDLGSDPRHARQAALAALQVGAAVRHEMQQGSAPGSPGACCRTRAELGKVGIGVATGGISVPRLPAQQVLASPRAGTPALLPTMDAHGEAIQKARALAGLCPLIGCRVLASEQMYEALGHYSEVEMRAVDLAGYDWGEQEPVSPVDPGWAPPVESVYELRGPYFAERPPSQSVQVCRQVMHLLERRSYAAAVDTLTTYLQQDPADRQARRLVRLAAHLQQSPERPYTRRFRGFAAWDEMGELPEAPPGVPPAPMDDDDSLGDDADPGPPGGAGNPMSPHAGLHGGRVPLVDTNDVWLIQVMHRCTDIGMRHRYYRLLQKYVRLRQKQRRRQGLTLPKSVNFTSPSSSPARQTSHPSGGTADFASPNTSSPGSRRASSPASPVRRAKRQFQVAVKRRNSEFELRREIHLRRRDQRRGTGGDADNLPQEVVDHRGCHWHRSQRTLGKGAFGSVWVGMGVDGGLVAMKALPLPGAVAGANQQAGAANRRRRGPDPNVKLEKEIRDLISEVKILTDLRHEHIVSYYGSAVTQYHVWIMMELCPGGCLATLLRQFGRLPVSVAVRYTKNVVKGLHFLHGKGIVHRDLKPGNVLLTIEGVCKLADFGSAGEIAREVAGARGNQAGVGTAVYMAPEAARGNAGPPSDIWSCGVLLLQLLTGSLCYSFKGGFNQFRFLIALAKLGQEGEDVDPEAGPQIPRDQVTEDAASFAELCFCLDDKERPNARDLLTTPFLLNPQREVGLGIVRTASADGSLRRYSQSQCASLGPVRPPELQIAALPAPGAGPGGTPTPAGEDVCAAEGGQVFAVVDSDDDDDGGDPPAAAGAGAAERKPWAAEQQGGRQAEPEYTGPPVEHFAEVDSEEDSQ